MSESSSHPHTDSITPTRRPPWRAFVLCMVGGAVLAAGYTAYRKPQYEASATIILPSVQANAGSSLANQLGLNSAGPGNNIYMFKEILESSRARKAVGSGIGLSRGDVKNRTLVVEDATANTIAVLFTDTDKERARKAVEGFLNTLREIHRELSIPTRKTRVTELETNLVKTQAKLRDAEESLRLFQLSAKTVPTQTGQGSVFTGTRYAEQLRVLEVQRDGLATSISQLKSKLNEAGSLAKDLPTDIPAAKQWRDRLVELEYELKVAEISAGPKDPKVVRLTEQIGITKSRLRDETDRYLLAVGKGVADSQFGQGVMNLGSLYQEKATLDAQISALSRLARVAPTEAMNYQRLVSEVAILNKLIEQQRTQLEQARLDAQSDPNRWEILDEPEVSDQPVNKDFLRNIAVGIAIGFVVALAWVTGRDGGRK